nr:hypothetical protein [Tanacetum cinerariifolium]
MVSNVNVLGPGVLDIVAAERNGTTIVTIQGNLVEVKTVVSDQFIAKELSTFGCTSSRVLTTCMVSICIGPDQFIAKELSTSGCTSSRVLTTCMVSICIGREILTEYHTMPEGPVLTRTRPSLDDRHASNDLDQCGD